MRNCLALGVLAATLAACSPKAAIETLAGEKGVADAAKLFAQLCASDQKPLIARFHPKLVEQSADQLKLAPQYCPSKKGKLELVGYQTSTNVSPGKSLSQRTIAVVQQDGPKRWVVASFMLEARDGGPEQVMQWNINAMPDKPPELAALDQIEDAVPTIRLVLIGFVLLIGGLVAWLIIRAKRKAERAAL